MTTRVRRAGAPDRKRRPSPRRTPIQRRSQVTVEDILVAAAQIFEKHGYAAGTTNRIAARAGVSIGTLYQYFPNKEALAVALLERHIGQGMRMLEHWAAQCLSESLPLAEALRRIVEGMIDLHLTQPRLQHMLLEETPRPTRIVDAWAKAERDACDLVAGLLRSYPEVRAVSVEIAAKTAVQVVEAMTHRLAADPATSLPREAFSRELVAMVAAYLCRGEP